MGSLFSQNPACSSGLLSFSSESAERCVVQPFITEVDEILPSSGIRPYASSAVLFKRAAVAGR